MKIFEIFNKEIEDKMPYDVVDDVHFHLLNDDMFYRKYYLPCMEKMTQNVLFQLNRYLRMRVFLCV